MITIKTYALFITPTFENKSNLPNLFIYLKSDKACKVFKSICESDNVGWKMWDNYMKVFFLLTFSSIISIKKGKSAH